MRFALVHAYDLIGKCLYSRLINCRLLVIFFVTLVEITLNIGRQFPDSRWFIALSKLHEAPYLLVNMRIALPLVAGTIAPLFGYVLSFGLINGFFWVASAFLAYKITEEITGNRNIAFSASLLFTTSVAMLVYGASVLSDPPAYFFVGLALYLTVKNCEESKCRTFINSFIMGLGGLFHPVAIIAFIFVSINYLSDSRKRRASLLSIVTIGLIFFIVSCLMGWIYHLNQLIIFAGNIQVRGALESGPFLEEFMWTFNITAPLMMLFGEALVEIIFFFSILALGFFSIRKKADILAYLPFLSVIVFIQHISIDRILFILWPCLIPIIATGLYFPCESMEKILRKYLKRVQLYPGYLLVYVYIIMQGLYNNYVVLQTLGLSPFFQI